MTHRADEDMPQPWPRLWRVALVALCTLILCSCRTRGPIEPLSGNASMTPPTLPRHAFTGGPLAGQQVPVQAMPPEALGLQPSVPQVGGVWSPPGIAGPWPRDEYLADGGDEGLPAQVEANWQINGLEQEDTVAHFDTLAGKTLVQPSNRVHIYSPRFGAVRQVVSLTQNEQLSRSAGVHLPTRLVRSDDLQIAATSAQNIQAERRIVSTPPASYRSKQGDGAVSSAQRPLGAEDARPLFENVAKIGQQMLEESETAWLAEGVQAAVAWSHKQAVQVVLDHQAAMAQISDDKVQTVYTVKSPPGDPKLRVIKTASKQFAEPGDTVDFVIRFENVGNQPIGNVTIIDNLSTRLEYVPDTAECGIAARFLTEPNVGESLVLRWEITEPLARRQGGVIRFTCRVR